MEKNSKQIHDFKIGDTVYIIIFSRLLVGIVYEVKGYDNYHPYVPVKWEKNGTGAPLHTSIHKTKEDAVNTWYDEQKNKLEKKISNLTRRKNLLLK